MSRSPNAGQTALTLQHTSGYNVPCARNFDLPLYFVVEDNDVSTQTPTGATWNKKREVPDDVMYYDYKSKYPHYGTGKWVIF